MAIEKSMIKAFLEKSPIMATWMMDKTRYNDNSKNLSCFFHIAIPLKLEF